MSDQKPTRLPLVATSTNRDNTSEKDAKLVNGYVETNAAGEVWCYKRPGCTRINLRDPPGRPGIGVYNWGLPGGPDSLYSVYGDNATASVYKNNALLGNLGPGDGSSYWFSDYLGATPGAFFHNDSFAYVTYGAVLTQVVDPDYPPETVPGSVYIDGTTYVMTPDNYILGSAINNPTSWDPLNSIQVQIDGGQGVAIAKQQNYLVAFKTSSVEVFYDAQNAAGSPLGRVEAAKLSIGCADGVTVANIDGVLYWVSASKTGAYSVSSMTGLKAATISTSAVERLLINNGLIGSFGATIAGHKFYLLSTVNGVLAYDIEEKFWSIWDGWNFGDTGVRPTFGAGYLGTRLYFQTNSGGGMFQLSASYYKDHGGLFEFDLYTPNFDGGSRMRKMVNQMEICADQTPGSFLQCRVSDDDYQTWSSFRSFDLGLERPILQDWGTFRRRAHNFRHKQNLPLRLRYVDLHADLGTL